MGLFLQDRGLLDAFRRGDRPALEKVYLHYGKAVYALLKNGFSFSAQGRWQRFRGCASAHDAEELMQEIFRKAFEERARMAYDGLRPYGAYLSTIARNHVLDELRRARHRLEVLECQEADADDDSSPLDEAADLERGPEELAMEQQLYAMVRAFREGLDPTERQVFDLRFGEEQEQEPCAEALGLSVYKVRKLERRMRKRLLGLMQKQGHLESAQAATLAASVLSSVLGGLLA